MSAIAAADFIVEAVPEKIEIKRAVLGEADRLARPEVILASNTSSISMTTLAATTKRPDRFVGMHFMNPVPVMVLVEVIRALETSDVTFETTMKLAEKLGKNRSEEHTSELQSRLHLVCRLLLEKKNNSAINPPSRSSSITPM